MQRFQKAHLVARFMLVWFALYVGVSLASPFVSTDPSQLVCSAMGGLKMVSLDDKTGGDSAGSTANSGSDTKASLAGKLDCPLCTQVSPPQALSAPQFDASSALSYATLPLPSAHIAWLTGSPLPPRGPPLHS